MRIMAVDFGDARTGLAVCDKDELLASPIGVICERNFEKCAQKVCDFAEKNSAQLIVVGLPKNMNGTKGERAEKCERFAMRVKDLSGIPIEMWDERCTTVSAHNYLNITDTRGKKRKSIVDAVAAVIILESYMQYRKNQS